MKSSEAPQKSIVMFSGGRDSSLAACLEANSGSEILLMTAKTGATIETDIIDVRVDEIMKAFPRKVVGHLRPHSAGIFRRIAIADIEEDFRKYGTNLILLGHQMAIQCEAIIAARVNGVSRTVTGFSSYQADEFMEQMPIAIKVSEDLFASYGITFEAPVRSYSSLDDVKFQLLDFGVTTKSLESVSLFADSFSVPSENAVFDYMESKIPTCRRYIELKIYGK
ncbi:hypothetical protein [Nocardiopsis sp. NRRL B-16309]|uniref:hypothetical protein n=1 Tax=Nocardiopsis sp. NRRL B-16309 TaxID=1519494 RepID=UPI0012E28007|nr:hypothetical protein [Nocardiopsis sp. NRRL B-16309]